MMNGIQVFMIVIAVICIFMLYTVIWWPVATVAALVIMVCMWGFLFSDWEEKVCQYTPEDDYCVQYVDR